MTSISSLSADLRDTSAQIASTERQIAEHPKEKALLFNLRSLQKRMSTLESRFAELSNEISVDAIGYRIISGNDDRYPVGAVGQILTAFQNMVTIFLDAVRSGPKTRARISAEAAALASLDFEYSYSGSLGFAMTLSTDRDLVGSPVDVAVERAFQVINSAEMSDVTTLAKGIGIAAVRSAYLWAKVHSQAKLGASIEWKRGTHVLHSTDVDVQQMARLTELIERTSELESETMRITGELVGISLPRRSFEFEPVTGGDRIIGSLADSFGVGTTISIPSFIVAEFLKETRIHYSIEKEEVTWTLVSFYDPDLPAIST